MSPPVLDLLAIPTPRRGLLLNALHYRPKTPTRSALVLVPGLLGAVLGGHHDYRPLAERLTDLGYAVILMNLRCASDFAHAVFEEAADDIGLVMEHAERELGLADIALFGTSLGGPRLAYFLSRRRPSSVKCVGFLSSIISPYEEGQLRLSEKDRAALDAVLAMSRALVAAGKESEIVSFEMFPGRPQVMCAKSFIGFFGTLTESNASTVKFGAAIDVPASVIHGTKDEIALPPNAEAIYRSLTSASKRDLIWIEAAGHYLTPGTVAEDYAAAIAAWLPKIMPAQS